MKNTLAGEGLPKSELLLEFWSYRLFFLMRIHRFISSHDTAEDIFQEACIRFLDSHAVFQYPQASAKYFSRILHSLIMDHLKRQNRLEYRDDLPEICCDPQSEWNTRLLLDEVHAFVRRLPQKDGEFILARFANRRADLPAEFKRQYPTKSILRYKTAQVISRLQVMAQDNA